MKILTTGGLGAVGWPLVALLREKGNEVWVLDRPHHHGLNGRYYFRGDIGQYRQIETIFDREKFDVVYNLGAELVGISKDVTDKFPIKQMRKRSEC